MWDSQFALKHTLSFIVQQAGSCSNPAEFYLGIFPVRHSACRPSSVTLIYTGTAIYLGYCAVYSGNFLTDVSG